MKTYTNPIAILGAPKPHPTFLNFVKGVSAAFKGNVKLSNPNPPMTVFDANIAAYDAAVAAAPKGGASSKADRAAAKQPIDENLKRLLDYTQSVANMQITAEDAIAVILSAGMKVKKVGKHFKPELGAKNTGIPGSVLLLALALRKRGTYYFEFSLDQKTWTSAPDSLKASVKITGLQPLQTYYFRFRRLTRARMSEYSQVVSLVVH